MSLKKQIPFSSLRLLSQACRDGWFPSALSMNREKGRSSDKVTEEPLLMYGTPIIHNLPWM